MNIQDMFTEEELTDAYFEEYHGKYEFNRQNTQKLYSVINKALGHYRAVSAFRFDLRFPKGYDLPLDMNDERRGFYDNNVMKAFFEALSSRIKAHIARRIRMGKRAHLCKVRFVWAREQKGSDMPHYHVLIFLNRDAYRGLGCFKSKKDNLANKIKRAWASVLRVDDESDGGLVEFPKRPTYIIEGKTPIERKGEILPLLVRGIYFTKEQTKLRGFGFRCFGGSNT